MGLGLLVLALASAGILALLTNSTARAQPGPPEPDMFALHLLPGTVVAQGQNDQPAGIYGLTTYRVEEMTLPAPVRATVGGQTVAVDQAWRIVVVGGPFPVRALPPVLWIDDVSLGAGAESPELTEISAVTFDPTLLRDGATLSLSYGMDAAQRMEVPEKLAIGG
jgi:hypothetical protein